MEASGWESACERPDYLLPPRPRRVVALARQPAPCVRLDLLRAAYRERRSRQRVAPVGQRHQGLALVAPGAQVLAHRDPLDRLWIRSVAVALAVPRSRAEDRGADHGPVLERRSPHGPRLPPCDHVAHPVGHLGTYDDVQPVAALDPRGTARQHSLLAAHDHRQQRVARQAEVAYALAYQRVLRPDRELHHLGPEPTDRARLRQWPR